MPNPSMLALKLSNAASFYTKPYKWHRTSIPSHSASHTLCLAYGKRRLTPYAPLSNYSNPKKTNARYNKPDHINDPHKIPLGFAFISRYRSSIFSLPFSFSSSASFPPGPGSSSRRSGGDLVHDDDMSKVDDDVGCRGNGHVHDGGPAPPFRKHRQRREEEHSKLLTLPTVLTLGRVAAVPLLIATFYVDSWWGRTATTSIFIAAAVTDWLDGYLARKMHLGSAFGAFLDPVADKLMVAATLVLLCTRPFEVANLGHVPWLLTIPSIAIIGREITMSAVREWAASQDSKLLEAVAVNNLGKWKTATQMIALTILLATRDSNVGGPGILVASGFVLLYISAGLSVWSLVVYMSKIWRVLLK